jgi:mono/diheme cytochrome c family protein
VLRITSTVIAVFGLALASVASRADEDRRAPMPQGPYAAECGSCHVAYSNRMLAPAEWSRVLGDLEHHYGVDASLDAPTLQAVARGLGVATPAAPDPKLALTRITTQRWFREEHDEVGAATFRSPAVRSAANCAACHAGAERGDYEEDHVRIPR